MITSLSSSLPSCFPIWLKFISSKVIAGRKPDATAWALVPLKNHSYFCHVLWWATEHLAEETGEHKETNALGETNPPVSNPTFSSTSYCYQVQRPIIPTVATTADLILHRDTCSEPFSSFPLFSHMPAQKGISIPWLIQVTLYYKAAAIWAAWFSTYKRRAGEVFLL